MRREPREKKGLTVVVQNGNFDKALRQFKKKVMESNILIEYKEKQFYEKPSDRRRKEKNQQERRAQKKRMQEDLPKKKY